MVCVAVTVAIAGCGGGDQEPDTSSVTAQAARPVKASPIPASSNSPAPSLCMWPNARANSSEASWCLHRRLQQRGRHPPATRPVIELRPWRRRKHSAPSCVGMRCSSTGASTRTPNGLRRSAWRAGRWSCGGCRSRQAQRASAGSQRHARPLSLWTNCRRAPNGVSRPVRPGLSPAPHRAPPHPTRSRASRSPGRERMSPAPGNAAVGEYREPREHTVAEGPLTLVG